MTVAETILASVAAVAVVVAIAIPIQLMGWVGDKLDEAKARSRVYAWSLALLAVLWVITAVLAILVPPAADRMVLWSVLMTGAVVYPLLRGLGSEQT